MIVNKKGDLLKTEDCTAVMHQTNCLGVMGAGIAKQIKARWEDEVYWPYRRACMKAKGTKDLLGKIQTLKTNETPIEYIINVFGEYSFTEAECPFPNGRHTDYEALLQCFKKVKTWCKNKGITNIGMPKNLGCGLAGGDWDGVVYPMIEKIFGEDKDITLYIYEFYVNPYAAVKNNK